MRSGGLRSAARAAARQGDWRLAAQHYGFLARKKDARVGDRIQLGHALKESGDAEGARHAYAAAARLHPFHLDAQRQYGLFLRRLHRDDDARAVLARALVVEPHAADIKAELADMGIADEALLDRYMLRGILGGEDAKPREPGLFGRLAAALSLRKARASARAGDWPAAETHYRTLLRHAPDRINARVQLGHALLEQGRPAEAVTAYRRALLSSPREAEIHLHVGHALKNLDRRDSAFESYLTAWRLKPSFALALEELAALRTDRDMQSLLSEEEGVRGGFRATADPDPKALRSPTLLTEPSWLNDRQKLAFRFLAGSLAYKD